MVSIIVPVHNTESYLRECVDSILAQSCQDMEVILVDDGSTDSSGAICDCYAAESTRVTVLHIPNRGQSAARNSGVDVASGDLITFVDSDDVVHPDYLKVLLDLHGKVPGGITMSGVTRNLDSLSVHASHPVQIVAARDALERILYQEMHGAHVVAKLYDRALFGRVRFHEGLCYEDMLFTAQVSQFVDKVAISDAPTYFYRRNPVSTTNRFDRHRLDVIEVTRLICQLAGECGLEKAAASRRFSAAFHLLREISRHLSFSMSEAESECLDIVRELRAGILYDSRTRLKNKFAAVASYFGMPFIKFLSRL